MPPRHGKSEIASTQFPAYVLGKHPDWPMIHVSYNEDHSNDYSRKVRAIVGSEPFAEMFPGVRPDPHTSAAARWKIEGHRSIFVSTGIGGPITGRGARVAIIDDPLKNDEEADSALIRQRHRDWYTSTLYTRLERSGGVLLIMTRWHLEDLGGFVTTGAGTDEPPMDRWEVIRLPGLAEEDDPLGRAPGEPLWPEGSFTREELERRKRGLPVRQWEALYQQNPVPAQGFMLEVEKIGHCPLPPPGLRVFQAWDLAISTKQTADWTVGATIGIDLNQNVYLLNFDRKRYSFAQTQDRFEAEAREYRPLRIGIETIGYQSAAFQTATRRSLLPFVEMKPAKDKAVRAQLLADRIAMGKVFANKGAHWWRDFVAEALAFPSGAHDDMIDAATMALELAMRQRTWQVY